MRVFISLYPCQQSFLFGYIHSNRSDVISQCDFDLLFSNDWWCGGSFHVLVDPSYVVFGEIFIQILDPLFKLGCIFIDCNSILCIIDKVSCLMWLTCGLLFFTFPMVSFKTQNVKFYWRSFYVISFVLAHDSFSISKNPFPNMGPWRFAPMFPSKRIVVLAVVSRFWAILYYSVHMEWSWSSNLCLCIKMRGNPGVPSPTEEAILSTWDGLGTVFQVSWPKTYRFIWILHL